MGKKYLNPDLYHMDQVQAMFFLANAWLKIKPETIKNCWKHTNLLALLSKEAHNDENYVVEVPTSGLPLETEVANTLAELIPVLPGNEGEITCVSELDLEAEESSIVLFPQYILDGNNEADDGDIANDTECALNEDVLSDFELAEQKKILIATYENILKYEFPVTDIQHQYHRFIRNTLADFRAESNNSKEQTNLRSFFT